MTLTGASFASAAGTITGTIGTLPSGVTISEISGYAWPAAGGSSTNLVIDAGTREFSATVDAGSHSVRLSSNSANILPVSRPVIVADGQASSLGTINFAAGGRISGLLTYAGVSGVQINASSSPWVQDGSGSASVNTSGGSFLIKSLPTGTYRVSFNANSAADNQIADDLIVSVTAGAATPTDLGTVAMRDGNWVIGTVATKPEGVAYEDICVKKKVASQSWYDGGSIHPDANGDFAFAALKPGRYMVQVAACSGDTNILPSEQSVVVEDGHTTRGTAVALTDFDIVAGGVISGTIGSLPSGITKDKVCVSASTSSMGGSTGSPAAVGSGAFSVSGLETGTYNVTFQSCGWGDQRVNVLPVTQSVVVTRGTTTSLGAVDMTEGGVIEVAPAMPGGVPVDSISVYASKVPWTANANGSGVLQSGVFRMIGLPAGDYRVTVSPRSGANLVGASTTVTVTPGGTAAQWAPSLQVGKLISGRVSAPDGVSPASICVNASRRPYIESGGWGNAQVDENGDYRLAGLAEGDWRIQFRACSGNTVNAVAAALTVSTTSAAEITGADVTMNPGGVIAGAITVPAGADPTTVCVSANALRWTEDSTWVNAPVRADSTYELIGLVAGSYRVTFQPCNVNNGRASDLIGDSLGNVQVSLGATTTPSVRDIRHGATITGTVVIPAGVRTLASDLCVWANRVPWTQDNGSHSTRPDAVGAFTLQGLVAGAKYRIEIYGCGGDSELVRRIVNATNVTEGAINALAPITMSKGGVISGTVTSTTTITGICVNAQRVPWSNDGSGWANTTVASNGTYSLKGLSTGSYSLSFRSDSYCGDRNVAAKTVRRVGAVENAPATTQNVVLEEGGTITGTVRDGNGVGARNVCLYAFSTSGSGGWGNTETDASGMYRIKGLATATYEVNYTPCWNSTANLISQTDRVAVVSSATVSNDVTLPAGGSIAGAVTNADGDAVPSACVSVYRPYTPGMTDNGPGYWGWGQTDSDGLYRIVGLKTATYSVQVSSCDSASEYASTSLAGVRVMAGSTTSDTNIVAQRGGSISGVVTGADGAAAKGVCVSAQPAVYDPDNWSYGWGDTDDSGNYVLTGLRSGTYSVSFRPCDPELNLVGRTLASVAVTAGSRTEGENSQMEAGGVVTGHLKRLDGSPADGVCVSASRSSYDWTGGSWGWAQTDANGDYRIQGLASGVFTIDFYLCDLGGADADDTGNGVTIPLITDVAVTAGSTISVPDRQIAAAASISGRVTGTVSSGLENICVSAMSSSDAQDSGAWGSAVTDADGDFKIKGLGTGGSAARDFDLLFEECGGSSTYAAEWFNNAAARDGATAISVSSGATVTGKNAQLDEVGTLTGVVTFADATTPDGVCVAAFLPTQDPTQSATPAGTAMTEVDGTYSMTLKAGSYRIAFAPCGLDATVYRGEWYEDVQDAAAASVVTITGSTTTSSVNAELARWGTTAPTCNPMLFDGGNCSTPAPYRSAPISPDGTSESEISSPTVPAEVIVDPDMLQRSATIEIDSKNPSASGAPAPPTTTDGAANPLSPYIEVTVNQGGRPDTGGNWNPPLEVVIDVPSSAAETPDDQLVAYFSTSAGTTWTAIPYIGSRGETPELGDSEQDGYYISGTGADRKMHVLTRHATTFAAFGPTERTGGGGGGGGGEGGGGGGGGGGAAAGGAGAAPAPARVTSKGAQSASVASKLRLRSSVTLPSLSMQGIALRWRTSTRAFCKVVKVVKVIKKKKVTTWRVTGLKKGTCTVIGANAGSASYGAASISKTIKVG
jgi:protocatechuate 3,4-dioxygenase beta subunit